MEIVPYTTSGNVKEMCKFHEHWKCTEIWNFCTFTGDFRIPEMQLFFLFNSLEIPQVHSKLGT